MAKIAQIRVYDPNTTNSERFEILLPDHVTVTGNEDHFAMAYHDARMIALGMQELLERQRQSKADGSELPARVKIMLEGITF